MAKRSTTFIGLSCAFFGVLFFAVAAPAAGQYFGRNKVQYDNFDFKSFRTDHFEIYFYPEARVAVQDASRMAERWYQRHSRTFLREFYERKPIILYANDADFHQTNAISGSLGEGTGGVTESLKERVIMPLTGSYWDTDHVLGHELVHSFQYDIALSRTDSVRFSFQYVPLWLVEGMAEYLSVGRRDTHTAMWMRDAALRDDLPTIEQITKDMSYFPYRYGQAYMAYVGGKYGDAAVANLFKLSGRVGVDSSFVYTLGITADSLSNEWIQTVKDTYLPLTEGRTPADSAGRKVLASDIDAGDMNISPMISPDGQYVAFLSEKDLFNINLFIADANTGKVVKKLKSTARNSHFDQIRFISSSGSWSPDGKRFAFITFVQGDNEISILDWSKGSIERRISVDGVTAITNLAWSPDGDHLAFSGMNGGISDLYVLDLRTSAVEQLTNDRYADLQPAWSPDGIHLAFTTDRGEEGTDFATLSYGAERVGIINTETLDIRIVRPFDGMHHNPQFTPDGQNILFISDHDGFKDIYRLNLETEDVFRVTHLQTGVSGITKMSPAMSVAQQSGRMMFTVFGDSKYTVFSKDLDELEGEPYVPGPQADYQLAATLPPNRDANEGLVGNYLNDPLSGLPEDRDYSELAYSPRLKLDYVAPPSVGVQAGGVYGSGVVGGVGFFFSDMLGNQNLTLIAQANGTFKDIGAQAAYLNRKNRLNWGGQVGHIPLLFGSSFVGPNVIDPETGLPSQTIQQIRQRIYVDQLQGVAVYPFTTTRRVELTSGFTRYGFDYEVDTYYFSQFGVRRERTSLSDQEPDPIYFAQAGLALVSDYSFFGFTSPIRGGRSRFEIAPFVGSQTFIRLQADYRRYFNLNPFTFAIRGLHVGNYGATASSQNDIFTQEYLGYANSFGFVRGYSFTSFEGFGECTATADGRCAEEDRLFGTRMALMSVETRIPLFGTEQYGLINFPYLPTEVSFFADGGVAWTKDDLPVLKFETDPTPERIPVFSAGVSTRFNMFGFSVIEIFYAKPFQRPGKGAHFGFQIIPGW
ncbi:MAG: basic secretory protein-like protein [Rhodothermales bacterium]